MNIKKDTLETLLEGARKPAHAAVPIDEELAGYMELLDRQNHSLRRALAWYCEQATECRKIGSIGDAGRHALSADGGKRAREVLATYRQPEAAGGDA